MVSLDHGLAYVASIFSILKTNNRFVFSTAWKMIFFEVVKILKLILLFQKFKQSLIDYKNITKINDSIQWIYESAQKISGNIFIKNTSGIIYTSGTTNEPKGVMASNGIENVNSVIKYLDLSEKDSSPFLHLHVTLILYHKF